ncbi:hypothetical protein GGR55DRAFT_291938 [Xylaria sp. FL0064]|nr:hypothetical protein GGR55DRAFT_291938 [Xylaria sp. FL0064]
MSDVERRMSNPTLVLETNGREVIRGLVRYLCIYPPSPAGCCISHVSHALCYMVTDENAKLSRGHLLTKNDLILRQTLDAVADTYLLTVCMKEESEKGSKEMVNSTSQQAVGYAALSGFLELDGRAICLHVETRQGQELAAHRTKREIYQERLSSWPSVPFQWISLNGCVQISACVNVSRYSQAGSAYAGLNKTCGVHRSDYLAAHLESR